MGFSVIPTNIGGVSLNSALSPLAALFSSSNQVQNLKYPADLGTNPSMGHAVIIQAYDRTTKLQQDASTVVDLGATYVNALQNSNSVGDAISKSLGAAWDGITSSIGDLFSDPTGTAKEGLAKLDAVSGVAKAGSYTPITQGPPLSTISLFMPENVSVDYHSGYGEVSMTGTLGLPGIMANGLSDMRNNWKESVTPYATALGSKVANSIGQKIGTSNELGGMISQALGVVTNPQMQLLYRGIDLRHFQLEFVLTPRTAQEAQTIKDICDTFTFYSLPGLAGAQTGNSGQFLTPPQLFKIQFKFLGGNDVVSNISNTISSALNRSGLGFLTNTDTVDGGVAAKLFTVGDCVLENVSVNYTPNGWATYNDGFPVQTHLTLSFRETQMLTKEYFKEQNSRVVENFQTGTAKMDWYE